MDARYFRDLVRRWRERVVALAQVGKTTAELHEGDRRRGRRPPPGPLNDADWAELVEMAEVIVRGLNNALKQLQAGKAGGLNDLAWAAERASMLKDVLRKYRRKGR
jgi:hypothetical protein